VAATTQNINEEDQAGDHNTAKRNATGLLRGAKCTHFPKQVYLFFVRLVKPIAGQRSPGLYNGSAEALVALHIV